MFTPNHLFVVTQEGISLEGLVGTQAQVAAVHEVQVGRFQDAVGQIRTDLPKDVREQERTAAGKTAVDAINAVVGPIMDTLGRAIAVGEGKLLAPQHRHRIQDGLDPADSRMAEAEGRQILRDLPQPERDKVFLEANREGKTQTIRMFELAPETAPLIDDPEVLREGADLFAAFLDPKEWQLLTQRRELLGAITHDTKRAAKLLDATYEAPVEDLIAV